MICIGCGYSNKPGLKECAVCSAPLPDMSILKQVPKNALLGEEKSGGIYFYIAIALIFIAFYYLVRYFLSFQDAVQQEDRANIACQIMKHKADLLKIDQE